MNVIYTRKYCSLLIECTCCEDTWNRVWAAPDYLIEDYNGKKVYGAQLMLLQLLFFLGVNTTNEYVRMEKAQ